MDSSFFIFFYIFYAYWEQKQLKKKTYGYAIYNICKKLFKLKEKDFKKGIWPFIDENEDKLKRFITINKGS